jgi:hypothetical protein
MTDKKVGIWIDHRKAVIVKSDIEAHPRNSGSHEGEKKYEERVAKVKEHYGIAF